MPGHKNQRSVNKQGANKKGQAPGNHHGKHEGSQGKGGDQEKIQSNPGKTKQGKLYGPKEKVCSQQKRA